MVRTREKPHLNLRRAVAHHPAHRIAVVSVSRETLHHVRRLRKLNVPPHNLAAFITRPGPPEEITGAELPCLPTWHFRPSSRPRHRPGSGGRGRTSASAPAAVINVAGGARPGARVLERYSLPGPDGIPRCSPCGEPSSRPVRSSAAPRPVRPDRSFSGLTEAPTRLLAQGAPCRTGPPASRRRATPLGDRPVSYRVPAYFPGPPSMGMMGA